MTPLTGISGKLDCIPDHIKQQKILYLEKLNHPIADIAIKHFNHYKYNAKEAKEYKNYNGWLDSIRGTNILDLDPIFEEILFFKES
jgi:hypothetical protein